jgi:hypothetical protein
MTLANFLKWEVFATPFYGFRYTAFETSLRSE